ncbi:MAG TPA: hypothetical protein ENN36_07310 [Candidatus Bathyarchaeota archaeon]|nr:hypothetical protein [Candidatus Bathyarchaeota archaeon]
MVTRKSVLELLVRSLVYSLIVVVIDFVLIVFLAYGTGQLTYVLSFVVLLEGGICLLAGGASVFYSSSVAKISEVLFHTKPWDAKRQKQVEQQVQVFIVTGTFLVGEALLLSAI